MFKKRKLTKTTGRSQTQDSEIESQKPVIPVKSTKGAPPLAPASPEPPTDLDPLPANPQKAPKKNPDTVPPGSYTGLKKASNKYGPIAANTTVRSTIVTDYQPDVCKDYKQTGYCGYGDSCKFLHIRENYAAGWQLTDDTTAAATSLKASPKKLSFQPLGDRSQPSKKEAVDPSKCGICKTTPTVPVKAKCGHIFCEACFLTHNKKNGGCAVCGEPTGGIAKRVK